MQDTARIEQLITATAAGDAEAFRQLYDATSAHLLALLLRMLKRRDWAEEALQDSLLKVWRKSETYDPGRGSASTWLFTIARHRALDLLRQKRPEDSLTVTDDEDGSTYDIDVADEDQNPEARAVEREGIGRLERCMKGLLEAERKSVMLAYYEGYTHPELATAMSAPLGTVKSWVRRGLAKLRTCLEAA
jgi:RNA polymerase sigma-70 factor (ECF subfamily)